MASDACLRRRRCHRCRRSHSHKEALSPSLGGATHTHTHTHMRGAQRACDAPENESRRRRREEREERRVRVQRSLHDKQAWDHRSTAAAAASASTMIARHGTRALHHSTSEYRNNSSSKRRQQQKQQMPLSLSPIAQLTVCETLLAFSRCLVTGTHTYARPSSKAMPTDRVRLGMKRGTRFSGKKGRRARGQSAHGVAVTDAGIPELVCVARVAKAHRRLDRR